MKIIDEKFDGLSRMMYFCIWMFLTLNLDFTLDKIKRYDAQHIKHEWLGFFQESSVFTPVEIEVYSLLKNDKANI